MPTATVSSKFLAALSAGASAKAVIQVGVYTHTGGGPITPVPGYTALQVESLTVTADRANAQRTTASLKVMVDQATGWPVPTDLSSPLAPNGNELVIKAGFTYDDGSIEVYQVGVFPIVSVVMDALNNLTITVTADDRSWAISRRALLKYYMVPIDANGNPAQDLAATIQDLLSQNTSGLPAMSYNIAATDAMPAPNVYSPGDDVWQAAMDLCQGAGWELFPDVYGNITGRTIPTPSSSPDWVFSDTGRAVDGLMIEDCTRTLTADGVSNDFFVISASPDTLGGNPTNYYDNYPLEGETADTTTGSPTNIGTIFGDIPSVTTSSTALTQDAVNVESQLDLALSLGQIDTLQLTGILNAAVQIDDVCLVTCKAIGLTAVLFVVDGFTSTFETGGGTTVYSLRRVIGTEGTPVSVQYQVPPTGAGYY